MGERQIVAFIPRDRVKGGDVVDAVTGEWLGTVHDYRFAGGGMDLLIGGQWHRYSIGNVMPEMQTGWRQTKRGRVPVYLNVRQRQKMVRRRFGACN